MLVNNFMEDQEYAKAHKRMKAIKGFYSHLSVYCTIIPIIIFVNLKFEPSFHWFWFSTLVGGWDCFVTGCEFSDLIY